MNHEWPPAMIDRLRTLAKDGHSHAGMALILSQEHDRPFTRNMINGACSRNEIRTNFVPAPRKAVPKQHPMLIVPTSEPEPIGPIGDLPGLSCCRFIRGEPNRLFRMCGHPTVSVMSSWCPYHLSLVRSSGGPSKQSITKQLSNGGYL